MTPDEMRSAIQEHRRQLCRMVHAQQRHFLPEREEQIKRRLAEIDELKAQLFKAEETPR